ncbi:hypothetical protein EVAR_39123_1 [Eumeta japonica]|uniref:Uncharacterized protein n=1 Tax=Eumeta variegata TaxID=151549 RepID=A0A4C1X5K5_EUMVA|nr:hypothetical protein EVAR_39123_1 [Eumeta japonica]
MQDDDLEQCLTLVYSPFNLYDFFDAASGKDQRGPHSRPSYLYVRIIPAQWLIGGLGRNLRAKYHNKHTHGDKPPQNLISDWGGGTLILPRRCSAFEPVDCSTVSQTALTGREHRSVFSARQKLILSRGTAAPARPRRSPPSLGRIKRGGRTRPVVLY